MPDPYQLERPFPSAPVRCKQRRWVHLETAGRIGCHIERNTCFDHEGRSAEQQAARLVPSGRQRGCADAGCRMCCDGNT